MYCVRSHKQECQQAPTRGIFDQHMYDQFRCKSKPFLMLQSVAMYVCKVYTP